MLTEYEEQDLIDRLHQINNDEFLEGENFSFDLEREEIITYPHKKSYAGRKNSCDISERLIWKIEKELAFETHLQTYILQKFDTLPLKEILFPLPFNPMWIGNEVFCGTGMQRIDLLIKQENEDFIFIKIIELKDDKIQLDWVQQQLSWYIKWVLWYIVPSYLSSTKKKIIVIPCIIVPRVKSSQYYELAQEEIVCLEDRVEISKLEVVLFHSLNDLLSFRKVIFN